MITRRTFIKDSSLATGAALLAAPYVHGAHHEKRKIRIGFVGTGSRGTYDMRRCLELDPNAELVAVADVFPDKVESSLANLREAVPGQVKVTPKTTFIGLEAYREIAAMDDIDLVFLTTPPGFRPVQFDAMVEAGKHVFLEKPGGVDPVGLRALMATNEKAKARGLTVVAGMQQRFMEQYQELLKRVWDGQIGEVRNVGAYWLGTMQKWHWKPRKPEWSDLEYQIRTWPFYTWLSGDCCVEQLCHNIDVNNWFFEDASPELCIGLGGRLVRTGDDFGNIYDHFSFEYEYAGGFKANAMNAQMEGITSKVENTFAGTGGTAAVWRGGAVIRGDKPWKFDGDTDGEKRMFQAMFRSIRNEEAMNMGDILANATMTAVLGRQSAYFGRPLSWSWLVNASRQDLMHRDLSWGPLPVRPVPLPGRTEMV